MSLKNRLLTALFGISLSLSLVPQAVAAQDEPNDAAETSVSAADQSAAAVAYPGGRRVYTVSLGQIPPKGSTSKDAWVRLGLYYFSSDGTVREGFFFWDRDNAVGAASTGVSSSGCDNCSVRTAKGFEPGNAGKSLNGTYTATDSAVTITWNGGMSETWSISHPASDLARIDLSGSNYGASVGYGFGSNASSDDFVPVTQIPKKLYSGRYAGISDSGPANEGASSLNLASFANCNGNCLSLLSEPSTACTKCSDGSASRIRYYMAGAGRRNFYEHWCRCLTPSNCYTGGSHRKPQLQVIGDNGAFHGWVGVEASNFDPKSGYFAVHYHTDI